MLCNVAVRSSFTSVKKSFSPRGARCVGGGAVNGFGGCCCVRKICVAFTGRLGGRGGQVNCFCVSNNFVRRTGIGFGEPL